MAAPPGHQNPEEPFPVLSRKRREQKPPNPLLRQDKDFYRLPYAHQGRLYANACWKTCSSVTIRPTLLPATSVVSPTLPGISESLLNTWGQSRSAPTSSFLSRRNRLPGPPSCKPCAPCVSSIASHWDARGCWSISHSPDGPSPSRRF